MSTKGVIINKTTPNPGVRTTARSTKGLIISAPAASGLAHGVSREIKSLAEAESLGITATFDKVNGVLCHYHIAEFYRLAKRPGTSLWIMLVARTVTLVQMCDETTTTFAKKLITDAKGAIRDIGLVSNPAETVATAGNYLVTAIGANGDTIELRITVSGKVLVLGRYTKVSGDTTVDLVATALRAAINAGTAVHGFVAGGSTANVALTAPAGYGASLNGAGIISAVIVGTIAGTITNFSSGVSPTYTPLNGIATDSFNAIGKAQLLADWSFTQLSPVNVIVEGKAWQGSASSSIDLRTQQAPKVSLVIGQDFDKADELPLFNQSAAVGSVLGMLAQRNFSENIGWVEFGNLTDTNRGRFLTAGFSNHGLADSVKADWDTLDDKGYIFVQTYSNLDGQYFNNDHTCVPIVIDTEGNINEHNLHYGHTADEAARSVYAALLPSVKSPQAVDPATGKLPIGVIGYFRGLAESRIDADMGDQISGRAVLVDPNSDLLIAKQLNASLKVVPLGSTDTIVVTLSINSRLS
jgi:hypothetical protein